MQKSDLVIMFGGPALILLGIAVLVASQILVVRPEAARDDAMQTVLGVIGWALIVVGFLGLAASFAIMLGIAGLLVWIAAAVVIAAALVRRGESQRYALLGVMATAAERLIPLGPAVEAFARERRGPLALRAGRLAQLIEAGTPLPEALRHCGGVLPREAAPMIRIGYESGVLAPALRQAASAQSREDPLWSSLTGKLVYLCVLPWFFLGILSFVMLKIVPSFVKIFADFELQLPGVTRALIATCGFLGSYWPLLGPLWLAAFALLFYAVLRYIGWIRFDPPGIARLLRRRHTAEILDSLSLAAGQGRPLDTVFAALAESYPTKWIRRRLRLACCDLEAGADWCDSLCGRGLIGTADRAVLRSAQRLGNLPWALKEMARSNRRRLAYRLYALVNLLYPVTILIYASVIVFFVVGMFIPLIALIQRLV